MPNQTVKNNLKISNCPKRIFSFWKNSKNILTADWELWGCAIFGTKQKIYPKSTYHKQKVFWKVISFLSTYWPLSLSKIFTADLELWGCSIFWAKMGDLLKLINKPCSFHSCLSTCQKSKSDINQLMRYWQLKNAEISLDESHFLL